MFLSLPPESRRALWQDEAFIDRGIRKLVEVGSQVAVASFETAREYAEEKALSHFASGDWQVSFVWNTGRCGSTLLHKAVSAMGTASFSEPHWLDQLQFNKLAEPHLERSLRVCVALEALTARLQRDVSGWDVPCNFVFNPKAGGLRVAEAAVRAFPMARHAFMYRACHKVVESFGGLVFSGGVPTVLSLAWRLLGTNASYVLPGPPLRAGLPLDELSSYPVASLTSRWINNINDWIKTTARRSTSEGSADPLVSAMVLRMDEFTSKDLALREAVVRAALEHFRVLSADAEPAAVEPAMGAFAVHSQAGSKMSGPKAQIVSEQDVEVIKRCVVSALGEQAIVQDGGANIVVPRSFGVGGNVGSTA